MSISLAALQLFIQAPLMVHDCLCMIAYYYSVKSTLRCIFALLFETTCILSVHAFPGIKRRMCYYALPYCLSYRRIYKTFGENSNNQQKHNSSANEN